MSKFVGSTQDVTLSTVGEITGVKSVSYNMDIDSFLSEEGDDSTTFKKAYTGIKNTTATVESYLQQDFTGIVIYNYNGVDTAGVMAVNEAGMTWSHRTNVSSDAAVSGSTLITSTSVRLTKMSISIPSNGLATVTREFVFDDITFSSAP